MFLVKNINDININNIFKTDKIKNTIIDNSDFIKLIYSEEYSIQKGIIGFFKIVISQNLSYKNKVNINFDSNNEIINKIINIENEILNKFSYIGEPKFVIQEQLKSKFIILYNQNKSLYNDNSNKNIHNIIIKISGIWVNKNNYGLTYKFLEVNFI